MMFEASQLAVHYGETFDLTCTVRGFPTNHTSIQTTYGVELTNQIRGCLDAYTTRAFAPIMDSEEGEFVCVSESYLLGSLEKHISITIYSELPYNCIVTRLASSPGLKRGPGTHCLHIRQSVPKILVHRILP